MFFCVDRAFQLSVASLVGTLQSSFCVKVKQQKLTVAERLFASGASVDQTTNNVLSLLVGASVELSQCQYAVLSRRRRLNFFLFKLSSTLSIITWTSPMSSASSRLVILKILHWRATSMKQCVSLMTLLKQNTVLTSLRVSLRH